MRRMTYQADLMIATRSGSRSDYKLCGISRFELNGVLVDGSGAILWPADLALANGQVVQAERAVGGNTLVARK